MSVPSVRETAIVPAAPATLEAPSRTSGPPPTAVHGPSAFARLLHGLGTEVQRGEALVKQASDGAGTSTLDAGQLIALQAGVYRYSEAIDLAARLIDHATTGLKTVLQGQ
jgi:hypothetical protein